MKQHGVSEEEDEPAGVSVTSVEQHRFA
jgi:hypothetical protein